ncbi:uncharacterized protein [Phyllobates terribilis]|uniref:uncharacterized protein n=1 Tax=Phyllobates terribilis TaxID=111132 RepID=UPI003CCB3613
MEHSSTSAPASILLQAEAPYTLEKLVAKLPREDTEFLRSGMEDLGRRMARAQRDAIEEWRREMEQRMAARQPATLSSTGSTPASEDRDQRQEAACDAGATAGAGPPAAGKTAAGTPYPHQSSPVPASASQALEPSPPGTRDTDLLLGLLQEPPPPTPAWVYGRHPWDWSAEVEDQRPSLLPAPQPAAVDPKPEDKAQFEWDHAREDLIGFTQESRAAAARRREFCHQQLAQLEKECKLQRVRWERLEARNMEEKSRACKDRQAACGPRVTGTVVKFNLDAGWGFIRDPLSDTDLSVNRRDVESRLQEGHPDQDLYPGDLVSYTRHRVLKTRLGQPAVDQSFPGGSTLTEVHFPEKFKQFCRLNIIAFDRLLSLMSPDLDFQDTVMRRAISAEERLLITLRFLATGESYTSLHLQFRVGKSTISRIVRCTCTVIWQKLQPIVMPSPTEETWLQVAAGFQTVANFPNCIGAVDGKHVRVQQPPRSGSRFFNYKKYFSVVLMAVADAHFKFVAIDVGAYGSTGDSRVFRSSQIGLQILQDGVTLPAPRPLPGSTHPVPFVMVSDEAFPLQTNLLRPYPRRALNARRRIFNYRLSRARRYVECTFGIMCSQWRIFHTAIQLDTETVDTVIKACCVLHNYAREYSTEQDEESQLSELIPVVNSGQGRPSNSGARVRETFADYFMSPEGAVHWQYSCAGVEQPDQQRRSDEQ